MLEFRDSRAWSKSIGRSLFGQRGAPEKSQGETMGSSSASSRLGRSRDCNLRMLGSASLRASSQSRPHWRLASEGSHLRWLPQAWFLVAGWPNSHQATKNPAVEIPPVSAWITLYKLANPVFCKYEHIALFIIYLLWNQGSTNIWWSSQATGITFCFEGVTWKVFRWSSHTSQYPIPNTQYPGRGL